MDEKKREAIRKLLIIQREDILQELRQRRAQAAGLTDTGIPADSGDQSLAEDLRGLLHQLGEGQREQILRIDEALERLRQGTYGQCQRCGEEISEERLEVRPFARFCIDCKTEMEEEAARKSGPGSRTL